MKKDKHLDLLSVMRGKILQDIWKNKIVLLIAIMATFVSGNLLTIWFSPQLYRELDIIKLSILVSVAPMPLLVANIVLATVVEWYTVKKDVAQMKDIFIFGLAGVFNMFMIFVVVILRILLRDSFGYNDAIITCMMYYCVIFIVMYLSLEHKYNKQSETK